MLMMDRVEITEETEELLKPDGGSHHTNILLKACPHKFTLLERTPSKEMPSLMSSGINEAYE